VHKSRDRNDGTVHTGVRVLLGLTEDLRGAHQGQVERVVAESATDIQKPKI
jgi:hypothetical protein